MKSNECFLGCLKCLNVNHKQGSARLVIFTTGTLLSKCLKNGETQVWIFIYFKSVNRLSLLHFYCCVWRKLEFIIIFIKQNWSSNVYLEFYIMCLLHFLSKAIKFSKLEKNCSLFYQRSTSAHFQSYSIPRCQSSHLTAVMSS